MSVTYTSQDPELGVPEAHKRLPQVPEESSSEIMGMIRGPLILLYFLCLRLVPVMQMSLRELQAELNEFLAAHTEKVLSLQASLSSTGHSDQQAVARAKLNMRLPVHDIG
jgi:hypothetical protein